MLTPTLHLLPIKKRGKKEKKRTEAREKKKEKISGSHGSCIYPFIYLGGGKKEEKGRKCLLKNQFHLA